ncbi:MAG: zinc-dependent peptidase [Elusimicrobia bacterium]|nr:zinc-dependent peptidase [Elusimicrobiota bacterium]MBK7208635.1 zinc-dependent peptidase [Elusimicrobiota bacterium]MBK7545379.1 zinc-dependent peptidase [Elusimicrobiota bacterium]MBK7575604.1 zinc-dependent peptidase [Elusimicrobiota bacterium]MBK7688514.1 zinc-dependent peptidase [Elusimicrobiota bacterium]
MTFAFPFRKARAPEPIPARARALLRAHVAPYRRLDAAGREALERAAARLRREKHVQGCGGFRVTERARWTIAGHAALLLLGRDMDGLPGWRTTLVYPAGYRARGARHLGAGVVGEEAEERAGEATRDVIVLSWSDAVADEGRLVLHETAHQVDFHFGLTEHLLDRTAADLTPWQRAWRRAYRAFRASVARGGRPGLDPYAAEDPAEFFAVATEDFFTAPRRWARRFPRLHALLRDVYRFDPLAGSGGSANVSSVRPGK